MKIIKDILNFILALTISLFILLFVGENVLLNENNVKNHLNEINYYHEIYSNIREQIENNTLDSGLNTDELTNLIDENLVKSEVDKVVEALLENKELEIDSEHFKENLDKFINNALSTAGRIPNYEEKQDIKLLEDKLVDIYMEEISIIPSMISKFSSIISKVRNILKVVNTILIVLISLLLGLTIILNKRFLKMVGTSLTAVGIITFGLKLIIGQSYQNISIISSTFSNLIVSLGDKYFNMVTVIGGVILLVGLVLIIIDALKQAKKEV